MKIKIFITALGLALTQSFISQNEFKKVWETKTSVQNKWNDQNDDFSLILVGDLKDIEMIDGTNGKSLWKFNIKEKLGVKQMEDWFFLWAKEGEPVEIVYKKTKEETKTSVYLNPRTGNVESAITESTLKDKPIGNVSYGKKRKKIYTNECYDQNSKTELKLNFKDKLLKNAASGTMTEMTISANGGNNWTTTVKGKCVRHLCDILLSANEPDMMANISVAGEKVFIVYEGITVLDLKTGRELWNTTFDNIQTSVGLKATQEIGRSPMPVASNDAVYICDFSKGEKAIKKLDINTGSELWKSEKLSKDDVVSQLIITENSIVAKFGGTIRIEKFIPDANGGIGDGTYKAYNSYEGESVIRAYDVSSGKQLWNTEKSENSDKFSRSECTILKHNDKLIACSDKLFYILNTSNGSVIAKSELGKEIGKAKNIFVFNDNYIVEGDEGIASFSSSGAKNYSVSTNKVLFTEFRGDAFIVWTGNEIDNMNEFICFDLNTGKITGKLKGCYKPRFNSNGSYFIRFNDETITKHQTY
jgi:outer membrane protein assembly factor BamB